MVGNGKYTKCTTRSVCRQAGCNSLQLWRSRLPAPLAHGEYISTLLSAGGVPDLILLKLRLLQYKRLPFQQWSDASQSGVWKVKDVAGMKSTLNMVTKPSCMFEMKVLGTE